ncbi:MAG: DUF3299 domain-containing protein [Pseudomonadota bacterium]
MKLLWLPFAAFVALATPVWAAEDPRLIAWDDLMPEQSKPVMPDDLTFGGNDDLLEDDEPPDPGLRGMVMHGMTPMPDIIDAVSVVEELNDVQVKIAGYVLPLDFEATTIREFLLVPYVGACIHVPPPPPNQIIHVTSEEGVEIGGIFEPMWITGTLQTASVSNDLAEIGYQMTLNAAEPYEY